MKKALLPVIALAVVATIVGGKLYLDSRVKTVETSSQQTQSTRPATASKEQPKDGFAQATFQNIKSAHYVSSDPANNALLASPVQTVSLRFNFDLVAPTKINVTRDGVDVTSGSTQISADKLTLSVPVKADQTGNYKVSYTACWPDKSCHEGSFGFSVKLAL